MAFGQVATFFAVELVAAVVSGSLALISDAWHMAAIDPILTESVTSPRDALYATALFVAVRVAAAAPWLIVLAAIEASPLLAL